MAVPDPVSGQEERLAALALKQRREFLERFGGEGDLVKRLRESARAVRDLNIHAADARAERDHYIVEARSCGMTIREIERVTRLTNPRICQIVKESGADGRGGTGGG